MNIDYQHSLHISAQTTYKNDLEYHKKYHIKYAKRFNLPTQIEFIEKRKWLLFFRRLKTFPIIETPQSQEITLMPCIPWAIEFFKTKKGMHYLPIMISTQGKDKALLKFHTGKLFKNLRSLEKIKLSVNGNVENMLSDLIRQSQSLFNLKFLDVQLNSATKTEVNISNGMSRMFKSINRFRNLQGLMIHLQDIQLSNDSLSHIFSLDKIKKPLTNIMLLNDNLKNMDGCYEFDDFDEQADQFQEEDSLWQNFQKITLLANSLNYLHLQPLIRNSAELFALNYFFKPLGELVNLKTLILELPNLELDEGMVAVLSNSLKNLTNLRKIRFNIQFGMVSQKVLDSFYHAFEALNLHDVEIGMTYSSAACFTGFFKALTTNVEIRRAVIDVSYMSSLKIETSLCHFIRSSKNLREFEVFFNPANDRVPPSRKEFNFCFLYLMNGIRDTPHIKKMLLSNPKIDGNNTNIECLTEVLPSLDSIEQIIFDLNHSLYSVSPEIGIRFWEVVFEKKQMKKVCMEVLFDGFEQLMPLFLKNINTLVSLECFTGRFASNTIDPKKIVKVVERMLHLKKLQELTLHFTVNSFLDNQLVENIHEIFKANKFLRKGVVQIESIKGVQIIKSEAKNLFRKGRDYYYFDN